MMRFKCRKFRDRNSGRLRHVHFDFWCCWRWKLGCIVSFELPFGVTIREEGRVYGVPFGVWTHRRGRFSIFGLNLLFLGFHMLIDHEPKR